LTKQLLLNRIVLLNGLKVGNNIAVIPASEARRESFLKQRKIPDRSPAERGTGAGTTVKKMLNLGMRLLINRYVQNNRLDSSLSLQNGYALQKHWLSGERSRER
jgi:hypothetical protein